MENWSLRKIRFPLPADPSPQGRILAQTPAHLSSLTILPRQLKVNFHGIGFPFRIIRHRNSTVLDRLGNE